MSDIQKQWDQDVENYGDGAYRLYEVRCIDGGDWQTCLSNEHLKTVIFDYKEEIQVIRKDSAALPFDLERAKLGDVVEVNINNEIVKLVFTKETAKKIHFVEQGKPNIKVSVRKIEADSMLLMETPPRGNNASPEN